MFQQLFNTLSIRERGLLTLFVWVVLIAWLVFVLRDLRKAKYDFDIAGLQLRTQEQVLEQADLAEQMLQQAREGVDPDRTFSAAKLVGRLDALAREAGLVVDISPPDSRETDIFSVHTVRLSIKRADIQDLMIFDYQIKQDAPYIQLNQFQVVANRRDPRQLDATFEITSFELKQTALN